MKVWRVESKDGVGPYNEQWMHKDTLREEHSDIKVYPDFAEDFPQPIPNRSKYIFGFRTKMQAYTWFEGWFGTFRAFGFELREVDAHPESVIDGKSGKQIIFRRPSCHQHISSSESM